MKGLKNFATTMPPSVACQLTIDDSNSKYIDEFPDFFANTTL